MLETGIRIEAANPSSDHIENMTQAVVAVLEAGHEFAHDQETVRAALQVLSSTTKVENVTIQNCYITGGKTVHMDDDVAPEPAPITD